MLQGNQNAAGGAPPVAADAPACANPEDSGAPRPAIAAAFNLNKDVPVGPAAVAVPNHPKV